MDGLPPVLHLDPKVITMTVTGNDVIDKIEVYVPHGRGITLLEGETFELAIHKIHWKNKEAGSHDD